VLEQFILNTSQGLELFGLVCGCRGLQPQLLRAWRPGSAVGTVFVVAIIDAHAAMLQTAERLQYYGAPGTLWRPYPGDKLRRIVLDGRHFHANPCPIAGNGVERLRDARPAGKLPKVHRGGEAVRVAGLAQE